MNSDNKQRLYVAGHRGLLGSALTRKAEPARYTVLDSCHLDLRNTSTTDPFFAKHKPDLVILAAAKVGGIHANSTQPVEFLADNLAIYSNVIHSAYQAEVKRLIFVGSNCSYPRNAPQPIPESELLNGPVEPTNSAFAMAKLAAIELCRAYNQQYGTRYLAVMPTSLYGPGDNFDPKNSHVMAAMIRRFVAAKASNSPVETIWGTGTPLRELLYVDDCADACLFLAGLPDEQFDAILQAQRYPVINIGGGTERSILQIAQDVAAAVGYTGKIVTDPSKPDGVPRKLLDNGRLAALGWQARTSYAEGLRLAIQDYLARFTTDTASTN
ncbi:GDP-L-fucose synthase family protein [Uliginosibacterium gangwonense]|uniref:GDP-L-fucose synthase family protein n=1 Tax=Uliginosibacterium gangwonense TaxID=392736 RepID=UPI00035E2168|nr:GDP-L-fucose synthase [Uliginosibacterium gangwonense]